VRQGVATRAAAWRAWSIWAVSLVLTATTITATVLHPLPARLVNFSGSGLNGAVSIVLIGAFATVGALLAWKRPANPIGWLLSAIGLESAVAVFSVFLAHFPRTVTLASWLGFLYLLGFGLCVVVVLLFPTGKLPSRRWRPVAWAAWAGLAGWVLGCAFAPTLVTTSPATPNPLGATGPAGDIFKVLAAGGAVLFVVTGLAAVLSLVFRYRRAQAAERAQLRWLVYAGTLIVVAVAASLLIEPVMGASNSANNLQNALGSGAVALIPVAIGIAVLRYRLYDIDRIISRTVAYAIVTGLLVGVYAGLVLLATEVLRFRTPVAVAAATLTAAALFTPVRRWVQSRVDRRFNRARYDADQIAAAFAARLKDTVDLGSVRDDLTGIVSRALEPTHVSVWISRPQDRG
jgi:hypothetical protein